MSSVTDVRAADPAEALAHFESLLRFETDCWDVHAALAAGAADFVLIDVRGPDAFAAGHVGGAINIPYRRLTERALASFADRLLVVYCAGPHCNGADKAAVRLAGLGRPVKKMIGGVQGWKDEGFPLDTSI